jgi:hypothetical protein
MGRVYMASDERLGRTVALILEALANAKRGRVTLVGG